MKSLRSGRIDTAARRKARLPTFVALDEDAAAFPALTATCGLEFAAPPEMSGAESAAAVQATNTLECRGRLASPRASLTVACLRPVRSGTLGRYLSVARAYSRDLLRGVLAAAISVLLTLIPAVASATPDGPNGPGDSDKAWLLVPEQTQSGPLQKPLVTLPQRPFIDCSKVRDMDARCIRTTERRRESYWYGWQLILTDAAAIGVAIAAPIGKSPGMAIGALGTYLFVPSFIHLAHGQGFLRAGQSLGLRVLAPALGALLPVALLISDRRRRNHWNEESFMIGSGIGIGIGVLGAMVVDAYFSKGRHVVERETWRPNISFDGRGVTLGVSGKL